MDATAGAPVITGGNVGLSPGDLTSITGFPSTLGFHAGDAVALQAQKDLTIAYNAAAGLAPNLDLTATPDLTGVTLVPGVYFFSSSALLTGTLKLDFQGNPDSQFVFQIGSTLTTGSGSSVSLINTGTDPLDQAGCNVFWQIGSSATLGTTSDFTGHLLALTSITLDTGATLDGSALARNGAVTLDHNTISTELCRDEVTHVPDTGNTLGLLALGLIPLLAFRKS